MENQAWNTGLTAAQNDTNQRMGALSSMGQLGNSSTFNGLYGLANSANMMNTNANTANLASQNITAMNQAPLTNAFQKAQYAQNNPWGILGDYYGIVGGNNWGQQGNTTSYGTSQTQQQPSMLSSIGSGLGIMGSLFG
jgi:hypothetical protein